MHRTTGAEDRNIDLTAPLPLRLKGWPLHTECKADPG